MNARAHSPASMALASTRRANISASVRRIMNWWKPETLASVGICSNFDGQLRKITKVRFSDEKNMLLILLETNSLIFTSSFTSMLMFAFSCVLEHILSFLFPLLLWEFFPDQHQARIFLLLFFLTFFVLMYSYYLNFLSDYTQIDASRCVLRATSTVAEGRNVSSKWHRR